MTEPENAGEAQIVDVPMGRRLARRAVLPWRQRIRGISRFDFTPKGFDHWSQDLLGGLLLLLMFPLWLPAAIVTLIAGVELLLTLPFLPIALLYRRLRHRWPVERFDERGRVVERTYHPSWQAAGERAHEIRSEHGRVLAWGEQP